MKGTLRKIQPLHPTIKISPDWEPVGVTPDGRQIFREVTMRTRTVEALDADGNPVYRKSPLSGELLHKIRRPINFKKERIFYLESEGNNNIRKVNYRFPSKEELDEAEREGKISAIIPRLAAALIDRDVEPDTLIAALLNNTLEATSTRKPQKPAPDPEHDDDDYDDPGPAVPEPQGGEEAGDLEDTAPMAIFQKVRREHAPGFWDVVDSNGNVLNEKALREADADEMVAGLSEPPTGEL